MGAILKSFQAAGKKLERVRDVYERWSVRNEVVKIDVNFRINFEVCLRGKYRRGALELFGSEDRYFVIILQRTFFVVNI